MLVPAIASISLGRSSAGHDLLTKIRVAKLAGFEGIEIFFECLEHLALQKGGLPSNYSREAALLDAANEVRRTCDETGLKVLALLPFGFYDGLLSDETRQKKIEELKLWFKLCHVLGTDMIQIPTNFSSEGSTGDVARILANITKVADLALQEKPPIRFAYEAISWGTHIDLWEGTWEVIKRVDRPNLGLCLDTFHIAGRVWADPTQESGQNPNSDAALEKSIERILKDVDPDKIFYVQLSDAALLDPPLNEQHSFFTEGQKPRMTWARNARLFPYEYDRGAYLPIDRIMDAIFVGLKWKGWVSMEVFNKQLYDESEGIPQEYATRGSISWKVFLGKFSERGI